MLFGLPLEIVTVLGDGDNTYVRACFLVCLLACVSACVRAHVH